MRLDRDFHYLLAEAAGNRYLCNEFEIFYNLSLRIWYLSLDRIRPEDLDVKVHLDILAAIEAHDACRAGALMRGHIQTFHTALKQYL
jgi:DNA-binding GntR family transcriptional regulator